MTGPDETQQTAFRAFSIAFYGRPGIEAACLTLQDKHGADVNIALLCCWVGGHGVRLSAEAIGILDQAVSPWRETVLIPLRALRRRMKSPIGGIVPQTSSACREDIKASELSAEFLAQDHMIAVLETVTGKDGRQADRAGVVRGNLLRYLGFLGVSGADVPRDLIETMVQQVRPEPDSA